MNLAIVGKTLRESGLLLLIAAAGIVLLEMLIVGFVGQFSKDATFQILRQPFVGRIVGGLLGADLSGAISATAFITIGFGHPIMYTLSWAFALMTCSRVIVSEIERGTADVLLSLPVSRASVYVSVTLVWVAAGVPICLATIGGVWLGERFFPLWEPLEMARLWPVVMNLFFLFLLVGAGTMCASTFATRRGPAIAVVLGVLLSSFLLNFLGQFWEAFERVTFLGVLHYYRPLPILQSGEWPVRNFVVLGGLAVALWLIGLVVYCRRDIPVR